MKSINKQATECEQGCSTQTCNNILPKNVCFPTKHHERKKKNCKIWHIYGKRGRQQKWLVRAAQMSYLTEKDFKEAIKNMFKELKETTIREVNKVMTTRSH